MLSFLDWAILHKNLLSVRVQFNLMNFHHSVNGTDCVGESLLVGYFYAAFNVQNAQLWFAEAAETVILQTARGWGYLRVVGLNALQQLAKVNWNERTHEFWHQMQSQLLSAHLGVLELKEKGLFWITGKFGQNLMTCF